MTDTQILEIFEEKGLINKETFVNIDEESKRTGRPIMNLMISQRIVSEEDMLDLISLIINLPRIKISSYDIDPEVLKIIDAETCKKYMVFPLFIMDRSLFIAAFNPFDRYGIEQIKILSGYNVEMCITTQSEIKNALRIYYKETEKLAASISEAASVSSKPRIFPLDIEPVAEDVDAPIIKAVNFLLEQALNDRATDIHIDPDEEFVRINFRIDGVLHQATTLPRSIQESFMSRIKIMAGMDIGEKRYPQDGFIRFTRNGDVVNLRVATYPVIKGEKILLRIFPAGKIIYHLKSLGFNYNTLKKFEKLIAMPHGIILVTGPTGSGKTTTLYAVLEKLAALNKNILTIEEPVEIRINGINQSQTNPDKDWTFSNALKAILRQDPDIIMVGEIRDAETARLSIQSSLTGHLVLSTLHTKDAVSAPVRLIDMGIEPYLISSSLAGILNQRLIRLVCPYCRKKYIPDENILKYINIKKDYFIKGDGCKNCADTGFLGRTGIFELMAVNKEIVKGMLENPTPDFLKKIAVKHGMKTLFEEGIDLILQDKTSPEELLRVTREEYADIQI